MRAHLLGTCLIATMLTACGGGGGSNGGGGNGSGNGGGGSANPDDRLALTATASATPVPSYANTDLDFTITNPSSTAATNVALTVTLGAGLTKAGVDCTSTGAQGVCPQDPATMSVASLPGGASVRFRMSVSIVGGATGSVTSSASVTATNDSVTTNNSAQVAITAYSADVGITGSTTATDFTSGSLVPYTWTVSNSGPDAARNLRLETLLSSGQTLSTLTCAGSGGASCPPASAADMTIDSLPSGGTLTFSLAAQLSINVAVSVSTTMRATAAGDSNFANNLTTVSALTRIPVSPSTLSFVKLTSDTGDYIGDGSNYSYDLVDSVFEVTVDGGHLNLKISGDQQWVGDFYMPSNLAQLQVGTYTDRLGAPFHDTATGGISWIGEGRGCTHSGWFKIDDVVYAQGQLKSVDIRFEQHCNSLAPALRGQIHWIANEATLPPGPVDPPPPGLWAPAPGTTPASGNYLYIESDPMDFIGQGDVVTFTQANSVLRVTDELGVLGVGAQGDTAYGGGFQPMLPLTRMVPGYYGNASRLSFGNPARARMDFGGNNRGCNVLSGWFVIDSIAYSGDTIIALDMRFEQHCETNAPSLRGRVHWRSDDPTTPAGPVVPPPAGLWAPPAGAIPASGNAIYITSEGEYIGEGITELYTPLNSIIKVGAGGMDPVGNRFQLTVQGDHEWTGFFQAMNTLPDLRAGYYGNLLRFPGGNPTRGSLDWSGEGRGCNELSGWFVIDSITYSGSSLSSIVLRFEQHCEYVTPALHGYIRWSASDARTPTPPVVPPPAGLWDAPAGTAPASGENYVYQQSEPGNWVGDGQTYLYTSHNSVILTTTNGNQVGIEVQGDKRWSGYLAAMPPFTQLQPGYYDIAGPNVARGIGEWYGDGRGCGPSYGWFVVDTVTYTPAGVLTALDARLEHRCGSAEPPLRIKIHWRADDHTVVPGPQNPPPAGLWATAAGVLPASGNYFYITGDADDFIAQGETHLFTPGNGFLDGGTLADGFIAGGQNATEFFSVHFDRMISIPRLQVGYYPNVQRTLLHNPTVAGMDVDGNGHGCTTVTGWFVIDSITHVGETVSSISARFEQHCDGSTATLHGAIKWSQ